MARNDKGIKGKPGTNKAEKASKQSADMKAANSKKLSKGAKRKFNFSVTESDKEGETRPKRGQKQVSEQELETNKVPESGKEKSKEDSQKSTSNKAADKIEEEAKEAPSTKKGTTDLDESHNSANEELLDYEEEIPHSNDSNSAQRIEEGEVSSGGSTVYEKSPKSDLEVRESQYHFDEEKTKATA